MPEHDPTRLVMCQIQLEYELDSRQRLIHRPGSGEQALCVVYRYAVGGRVFFYHALPPIVQVHLHQLDPSLAFSEPWQVDALLGLQPPSRRDIFQASFFLRSPAPEEYPLVEQDGEAFIIPPPAGPDVPELPGVDASQPVAIAWSVRQDDEAAELAVETQPAFRRRGYARQVSAAWAAGQFRQHRVALYSHKASNLPSLALRQSLGAVPFASSITWEAPA